MSEQVTMSAAERAEWEAFKAEKRKRKLRSNASSSARPTRKWSMMNWSRHSPELLNLSGDIKAVKDTVFGNFAAIIDMKAELFGTKDGGQYSHTFTNSDSTLRLTLGVNTVDGYRDTVEDGIAMVRAILRAWRPTTRARHLCRQFCAC